MIRSSLCRAAFLSISFSLAITTAEAATTLTPVWRYGIVSDNPGLAHVAVADMNRDGIGDIVSCSDGAAYVLTSDGAGGFKPIWFSDDVNCSKVAVGDANHDGQPEIYVLRSDPNAYPPSPEGLYVFTTDSFRPLRSLTLPLGSYNNPRMDLVVADVDGDGELEIVTTKLGETDVYSAATLALKWQAGWGGTALGIGDVDGDGSVEIVVNSNPAYILDAKNKTLKWALSGGFGTMAVADVDGDGKAEVLSGATGSSYGGVTLQAIDATTGNIKWSYSASPYSGTVTALAVADINGDGTREVLAATDTGNAGLLVIRGTDGTLQRTITPANRVAAITAGQVDGDSGTELVWASNSYYYSGPAGIVVADALSGIAEWTSADLDGPLHVAVRDLNGDGHPEVLVAAASMNGGSDRGAVLLFDGVTHNQLTMIHDQSSPVMAGFGVGQLDADAALEIVELPGSSYYSGSSVEAYDSSTHLHEWSSPRLPAALTSGLVANIGGSTDKIVVGLSNSTVEVMNGASTILSWVSPTLDGQPLDLAVAQLGTSGSKTLAILTASSVYLYDTSTWTQLRQIPVSSGLRVALVPQTTDTPAAVVVGNTGYSPYYVTAFSVSSGAELWKCTVPRAVRALALISVGGRAKLAVGGVEGMLRVFPLTGDVCSSSETLDRSGGTIGEIRFADADGDGSPDLVTATDTMIEVDHVIAGAAPTGDVNGDQVVTAADVFYLLNYMFSAGPLPVGSGDVNGDGSVSPADAFYLINYLFAGGPAPH